MKVLMNSLLSKGNSRSLRVLRKKRSIGLMEDLWDESVFEDSSRTTSTTTTATPTARATPVIKISFGAQGEGTVLKIPSKIQDPYLGTFHHHSRLHEYLLNKILIRS